MGSRGLTTIFYIASFCSLILLIGNGCKNNSSDTLTFSDSEETPDSSYHNNNNGQIISSSNKDTGKWSDVYYRFPSPDEMLRNINSGNYSFSKYMLNPTSNVNNYLYSYSQSLNLGIYIADLAYVVLFDKLIEAQKYLEVVESLGTKVNVQSVFDEELQKRIKNNLDNIDSLSTITRDTYNGLIQHLDETDNEYTLAIISSGAYVEALHLAINQVPDYQASNPIIHKIFDQRFAFDNLLNFMLKLEQDEDIDALLRQLNTINEILHDVEFTSAKKIETKKKSDGSFVLGGTDKKIVITKQTYESLKNEVEKVRTDFINTI